jgi:lipopolysaccharide export system permease protein
LVTFLRFLFLAIAGGMVIFILVDVFDNIGSFLDNKATVSMVARYYLYEAVWVIDIVLPIAMLMATLFTVGSLARYNELTALFAAGRSMLQVTRPLLVMAVLTALFSLYWREFVLPQANLAKDRVWEIEIHNRPERIRPTKNIALTGEDGRLYYARTYNPQTEVVTGLRVVHLASAQILQRIDAARAKWDGQNWLLQNGTRRDFSEDQEIVVPFEKWLATDLAINPDNLYRDRVKPEDMNIRQLLRHIELVRKSGGNTTKNNVDIQFKLAFPAVHIIVVFMGIFLASGPRKTTIATGFGLTVLISFGYYFLMNLGRALGHSGSLPPITAGWGGNAVYCLICWGLFWRARR